MKTKSSYFSLCCLVSAVVSVCEAVEVGGAQTNISVSAANPYAPPQYRRPSDWKPTLWTQDLATVSRVHSVRVMDLARAQMEKVDAANRCGKYQATGVSLDTHRCPEWLKDAKLGIFIDWGPWSVASWAPYMKGGRFYPDGYENHCEFPLGSEPAERDTLFRAYHLKNWGADFHRDHFLDLFRAEAFDAAALMRLFKTCGAKYVVPFLKHHGGYCLWDCPYTFRDSIDQGPRRDLAREMREACQREGLKFGFYFSHGLEWGYPILNGDGSLAFVNAAGDKPAPYRPEMEWTASGKVAVKDFVRDYTVPQAADFIDRYDPDLLWYDGDWTSAATINGGYDIAAYFYNRAEDRKEVAVNDRYGFGTPAEVAHKKTTRGGVYKKFLRAVRGDFFTSETADIAEDLDPASGRLWEECHGISHAYGNHWQEDKTTVMGERELIAYFTDIIARGGNLLLMVNLDGQGRLPGLQRQRLTALGSWLARWGGAIYGTRACAPYSTPEAGYLQSKDGTKRYAVILGSQREVELRCAFAADEEVRIFGEREALLVRTDAQGRRQVLIPPRWTMSELPYVLEIAKPTPPSPSVRAWRIETSPQAQSWERTAAAELELWLGTVTSNGSLRVAGREDLLFHVGDTDFAREKGLSSAAFQDEEWCIRSFGRDIVLNGGGTRGCLYAVSHFLEDQCGVRWWEDGDTDCPTGATLSFESLDRRGRPFFSYREIYRRSGVVADYRTAVRLRLNGNGYGKIPRTWGGGVEYGPIGPGHAWERLLPFAKYGKEHPEWYSLVDGRRQGGMYVGQLCLSNPELVPVMVEKMEEVIARGKVLAEKNGLNPPRIHALNMNDNKRFCQCAKCTKEIATYGHSGQQLRFVNAVAAVLGKRHPELLFKSSAYLYAEEPPKGGVRAADNVLVNWCNTRSSYVSSVSSKRNEFLWEMSAKWAPHAKERCFWDYMTTFDPTTYGWAYPSEVWYGEKFRYYAKLGVTNILLEHEMPEKADLYEYKLFLERHLVEDPQADVAALTDDFMARYYGSEAGACVRRSREILARACADGKGDVSWCPRRSSYLWLTDAVVADIQVRFDEAERRTAGDPVRLERVRRARLSIDRVADSRRRLRTCAGSYPACELAPQDQRNMKLVEAEGARVLEIDATSPRYDRAHLCRAGCSNGGPQFTLASVGEETEVRWCRYESPVFTLNDGYVHFLDWNVQLATGLPDYVGKRVRLRVEVKLTGPKFFPGSLRPNRIFVKTVALVPAPEKTCVRAPSDDGAFCVLSDATLRQAVVSFNETDEELYTNAYANAVAGDVLARLVPRFECPDDEITRTYYFRWWAYRKHLRRTRHGWVVTEFLPNVPWAGRENTISCPLGHHVREGRWLREAVYVNDYLRFMLKEGTVSGPRAYACWPAVSACEQARVTGNWSAAERLLPEALANFERWEKGWTTSGYSLQTTPNRQGAHGVPFSAGFRAERGLFDLPGSAEGSEFALSADGARILVNAALCAEALAIGELAARVGDRALAATYNDKAARIERALVTRLWNPTKRFFCALDVAGRLDDVRELTGYAPWYFGLSLPSGCDGAFAALGESAGFSKGLPSVARDTPGFDLTTDDTRHECLWNGPSWPYATSLALTALANRLQTGPALAAAPDFAALLAQYAHQHRRVRDDGRVVPWIDENLDPLSGEWRARAALSEWVRKGATPPPITERGKDYNHSTFCDLVISGLCGVRPGDGALPEVRPLAPESWDWWCVDGIRYHGRNLTVLFDRDGTRYGKGKGLQVLVDGAAPITAGWENVNPTRAEVAPVKTLWTANFARTADFVVERRGGAEGTVEITSCGIRVDKTNDRGYILVTARPFAAETNRIVRMFADVVIETADVDYSSGYLRAYGKAENLSLCDAAEKFCFYKGGQMTSRGMPCTAPGMTTRKYAQYLVGSDGIVTPALVVAGHASRSFWRHWTFEDFDAASAAWQQVIRPKYCRDHRTDRISEAEFDALLASDTDHVASVERRDGVSRLVVDGEIAAPVVFKGRHFNLDPDEGKCESYAGKPLDGSDVQLGVVSVILAGTVKAPLLWTRAGFDVAKAVKTVRSAMRVAPKTLFLVGVQCSPYPEFTLEEHPAERWLDANGNPVVGSYGSCVSGYLQAKGGFIGGSSWPWVSYSSRVWRDAVKARIRELVAELKRQGLSKRIVGVHLFGFHDLQFSMPYADTSEPARREYARVVSEGRPVSTNYDFVVKQSGFSAQEEFAREFKRALGKPSVAAVWCESPYQGAQNASCFFTSFCRSDAVDIVVCQPDYRVRLPAFSFSSVIPSDSFHLHGKLFLNEFDLRTYGAFTRSESAAYGPGSLQALGHATDYPMWQTIYRKHIGEMDALRQGYWFYDIAGGWYEPPEIAADIRAVAEEERKLACRKPSEWQPDVAVVVDEGQFLGPNGLKSLKWTDGYIYASQCSALATSGVPSVRYLAEDVLNHPELLDDKKLVVFAFMRQVDGRRRALLDRLSAHGVAQVFLSETGVAGGAEAIGFMPHLTLGKFNHTVIAEPGVADNVTSELSVVVDRDALSTQGDLGPRCTVDETDGVKVLARYASDRLPAIAWRDDRDCRRVYVCEPGGLTPGLFNRLAREAGAYVATSASGLQVNMNGDFISVHCLRAGRHVLTLPFRCQAVNLKTGVGEPVSDRCLTLNLTAGETCRFRLESLKGVAQE